MVGGIQGGNVEATGFTTSLGLTAGTPTDGYKGIGTINVSDGYYVNGVKLEAGGLVETSGTFTPILGGVGYTPSGSAGSWTKIGSMVMCRMRVGWSAITQNSTGVILQSLPFNANAVASAVIGQIDGLDFGGTANLDATQVVGSVANGANGVKLFLNVSVGSSTVPGTSPQFSYGSFENTGYIEVFISYTTNS